MTSSSIASRLGVRRLLVTLRVYRDALLELPTFRRWRLEAMVSDMDEVPLSIRQRRAYLVGTLSRPKWLVFDCACDGGHRILLNLDPARHPFWTLRLSKTVRALSLHPSVDYHDDSRTCHYILSNGRIKWVRPRSLTSTDTGLSNA